MPSARLFTLSGTRMRDAAIEPLFTPLAPELRAPARRWFEAMRSCVPHEAAPGMSIDAAALQDLIDAACIEGRLAAR